MKNIQYDVQMWEPIIFCTRKFEFFIESTREDPSMSIRIVALNIYTEKKEKRPLIVAFEIWGLAQNINNDANGTMK